MKIYKISKSRKLNLIFLAFTSIIFIQFLFIGNSVATKENIEGFNYDGIQQSSDGETEYAFNNNLDVNITTNQNLALNLEFSNNLQNHFFEANINTNGPISLTIMGNQDFSKNAEGSAEFKYKKKIGLNSQNLDQEDKYYIKPLKNVYFTLTYNTSRWFESLTLSYKNLETPQTSQSLGNQKISWAYYDRVLNEWFLLESEVDSGSDTDTETDTITTTLTKTDTAEILSSGSFTIAPVVVGNNVWDNPLIVNLMIFGGIAIVGATFMAMTTPEYRHYLLNRAIPIEKGVHKNLKMEDVLENENRMYVIDLILKDPGIHFNKIQKEIGISGGSLAWHLDVLETFKVIKKKRVGQYLTYYTFLHKNLLSTIDMKIWKSESTLKIFKNIRDNPGTYKSQIALSLKLDHRTVAYHINKLLEGEIISSDEKKFKKGFYINESNGKNGETDTSE